MKRSELHEVMKTVFGECHHLREAGQQEYAHDDDNAFANFDRVAEAIGADRKKVAWVYALKHVDGIAAFIKGHRSQREDVRGRISDLIVYLCILRGMIEEDDEWDSLS